MGALETDKSCFNPSSVSLLAVGSCFWMWIYQPPLPGAGGLMKEYLWQGAWNRTSGSSKGALHWILSKYLLRRLIKKQQQGEGLWVRVCGLWGSGWPLFNHSVSPDSFKFSVCFRMLNWYKSHLPIVWGEGACCFIIRSLLPQMSWTPSSSLLLIQSTNDISQVTTKPKASKD